MNAIEIKNLRKNFGQKQALNGLNMTVPQGAIYGFIGENGSGKSTTEKLICGLLVPSGGEIKLFGKDYRDGDVRAKVGVLIETPGCFPNYSVWNNLMLQAANLSIENAQEEVRKVLKVVRMEGSASNKFKNCSLGMKQRIGIAMALLDNPALLVLDEPINGLDADGMRIMREVLVDITKNYNCTVVVSSHILGELEKIATHYGIVRGGRMIKEMTAAELEADCPTYVALKTKDMAATKTLLEKKYTRVAEENGYIRVYDSALPEDIVSFLYAHGVVVTEIKTDKISLEEYYIDLMKGEARNANAV
ncbi:MAG: ATP-binding cassette domain-containing protein [Clostridia bacterium]|nr:ATP-binding cassette domain-containing protein [Clostridia bacterium]